MSDMSGQNNEEILAELSELRAADLPTRGGHTLAYVYEAGIDGLDELAARAYGVFATVNGLDMTAFPSVVRLENQIVSYAAGLLGGDADTRGSFTGSGTESIMLAVKAARDRHRLLTAPASAAEPPPEAGSAVGSEPPPGAGSARPSPAESRAGSPAESSAGSSAGSPVGRPKLVVPVTAHAAFHKAARFLDLELVTLPVDPSTFQPDPADYAAAIDERTALVVASAPSYAHGVIDPVAEIAAVAARAGVPCHVDACVGGWLLPFLRRLGEEIPPFDLSVPGVTSLSVDMHKYGFADKGASVVLYRDAELRRHQYFACAGWPGYPVVNPTVQGSKPAGLLASAWAVLRRLGDDGYLEAARRTRDATDAIRDGIAETVPELRLLGRPRASLLAFAGTRPGEGVRADAGGGTGGGTGAGVDVLHVADEMRARGWFVQPQLSFAGLPPNLHLTITPATLPVVSDLLRALRASVDAARALPPTSVDPDLAALAVSLRPDELTPGDIDQIFAVVGLGSGQDSGTGLPDRMAPVLALLDVMPAPLKERLLTEFVGRMYAAGAAKAAE
jgi:sphinganine-1-phosphate aldolase